MVTSTRTLNQVRSLMGSLWKGILSPLPLRGFKKRPDQKDQPALHVRECVYLWWPQRPQLGNQSKPIEKQPRDWLSFVLRTHWVYMMCGKLLPSRERRERAASGEPNKRLNSNRPSSESVVWRGVEWRSRWVCVCERICARVPLPAQQRRALRAHTRIHV
jgi:hypothetical protein